VSQGARPRAGERVARPRDAAEALDLGRFLPYVLVVTAESVSRLFSTIYEQRFGLSIPEWRVLGYLGDGPPRPTPEVIGNTGMAPVKVSRAVTRLVDKGLALREPNPADQRAQLLRLTPQGLAMYREIVPAARALLAELAEGMTEAELDALHGVLGRVRTRAQALAKTRDG
jgi:DNA-binding MarR family transcriptional regulator